MKQLLTAALLAAAFSAPAQTLFTYGRQSVSATEFTRAFQKANTGAATAGAAQEYLDLYIASRLKVAEARRLRYDTLPQMVADLSNLRQQVLPGYLTDKESLNKLITEAFVRQQKDLHIAHIFIAFSKNGVKDSATAGRRKTEALAALKKGAAFDEVARRYSDDPSALATGGNLGWVTVFTLPYALENIIYSTAAGGVSAPYQSKAGYHIFKNLGDRKAAGRIRAAQILLAFPPGSTDTEKEAIKSRADSVYQLLKKGADFGKLATDYSNDIISSASNGQLQEFGIGEYEPAFETAVFGLQKDGDLSQPFVTAHGYHIVQRLRRVPVPATLTEAATESLRSRVETSDRIATTKVILAQRILKTTGYKKLPFADADLWAFSDSVLSYAAPKIKLTTTPATPLLQVGGTTATAADWITFAQNTRYQPDGNGVKSYPVLWAEFVQAAALQYYQQHLEDFDAGFKRQLTEFADGNLFFEIMQRQVWTPAQTDSAALLTYYTNHKSRYNWAESADAVVFYAADTASGNSFYEALKKAPGNWRQLTAAYSERITADSNRFEVSQLPGISKASPVGTISSPVVNGADGTSSFGYVLALHPQPAPRSFTEARGLVIADYQSELEKQWITTLKKRYPVKVNNGIWKTVLQKLVKG